MIKKVGIVLYDRVNLYDLIREADVISTYFHQGSSIIRDMTSLVKIIVYIFSKTITRELAQVSF